jgi:dephospho-CoA kinase
MSTREQNWLLSGGIGSGKSTVRQMLAARGVTTIDADSIGHEVIAPGGAAEAEVLEMWPAAAGREGVDRAALAEIVFSDPEALSLLESITHPHIFQALSQRLAQSKGSVIVEIPLLTQPFLESLPRMVVDATDEVRIERAIERGQSESDVLRRMANQPTRAEWLAAAHLVIPNSGDLAGLEETVNRVAVELFSL